MQSIATDQRLAEGITLAHAIRRGDVAQEGAGERTQVSVHGRARRTVASFDWLAGALRLAS